VKYIKTYEGLFDFFKKKKPVRELPMIDTLYEPMEVPYMVEYEENHKTVPFTKSESDYLMGLVKDPSDVVYNSGHKFSANHYRVKINHKEFIIRKYDDEWFFVTIHYSKIKDINWRDKYKYYKCDTFDGVKQLITNKS
jgi:hypothetical protein